MTYKTFLNFYEKTKSFKFVKKITFKKFKLISESIKYNLSNLTDKKFYNYWRKLV